MTIETWKPVLGYEGLYEVSDQGRVRSVSREVVYSNGGVRWHSGRIIKTKRQTTGHLRVCLYRDTRSRFIFVHRLVLEAFVGPCPVGMEGCHYPDRDPANNALSNLRWDTKRENQFDRVKHGTHHEASKTHCPEGHAYEGENLIITKDGWRKCRECHRIRSAERHSRRRAAAAVREEGRRHG